MLSPREPVLWLPLAQRISVWALVATIVWGFSATVFLIVPLVIIEMWAVPQAGDALMQERARALMGLAPSFPYVSGFVVGVASGFYAPPREPLNPYVSRFLRDVATDTLSYLLAFVVAWMVAMKVLLYFVSLNAATEAAIVIFGYFYLFAVGLWLAINRALRALNATKLK